jgi:hypothetical protein
MVDRLFSDSKRAPLAAIPLDMDRHRFVARYPPPAKGSHGRAVPAEAGSTETETDALVAQGVPAAPG